MTSEAAPNPAVTQAAPEPAPEPAAPTKTIEDLRQLVLQIAAPKRIALVQELLNKVGVPKLSEIPEAQLDFAHDFLQKFFD
jgi:hypothetical protein